MSDQERGQPFPKDLSRRAPLSCQYSLRNPKDIWQHPSLAPKAQKLNLSHPGFEPKTCPLREQAGNRLSQLEVSSSKLKNLYFSTSTYVEVYTFGGAIAIVYADRNDHCHSYYDRLCQPAQSGGYCAAKLPLANVTITLEVLQCPLRLMSHGRPNKSNHALIASSADTAAMVNRSGRAYAFHKKTFKL